MYNSRRFSRGCKSAAAVMLTGKCLLFTRKTRKKRFPIIPASLMFDVLCLFESSRSIDCRLSAATVLEVAVLNTLFVPWSLNGLVALPKPYSVSVIQTLSDHSHLQQYCNLTIKYYRKNISQGIAVKSPFRLALFIPSKASL